MTSTTNEQSRTTAPDADAAAPRLDWAQVAPDAMRAQFGVEAYARQSGLDPLGRPGERAEEASVVHAPSPVQEVEVATAVAPGRAVRPGLLDGVARWRRVGGECRARHGRVTRK